MNTTMKAIEIMKGIKEELDLRLGLTQATSLLSSVITYEALSSQVSDGSTLHPVMLVGDDISTHVTFRIVVKPIEWALAKDVLGLASPVYTPHEILLGLEATSAFAQYVGYAELAVVVSVLAARGCRLTIFAVGSGDSFDTADFLTANLKQVIEPSVKYPMIMSQ
jgi:hypothetical protein